MANGSASNGNTFGKWNDLHNEGAAGQTNYLVSYNTMGFICEWDNSLTEYIAVPGQKTDFYGAEVNGLNDAGKVFKAAEALNKALNSYLETLREELEAEAETEQTEEELAQYLREKDESSDTKAITINPDICTRADEEKILNAIYTAYARYLQTFVDKGIEMNKINLKDRLIKIDGGLVQDIMKNLVTDDNYADSIDGYRITIQAVGFGSARFGNVTVRAGGKNYISPMVSTPSDVGEVLEDYVQNLQEITEDVAKQAVSSVLSSIADVTGFAEWEKNEIKTAVKKAASDLIQKGYGNVYRMAEKCRTCYELIEEIVAYTDSEKIAEAVTVENTKKLYQEIEKLSFTDKDITNKAIDRAVTEIIKKKQDLLDALYHYYTEEAEVEEEESFFDKVKNWFQALIQCPVDFEVFDTQGNRIGYVLNGEIWYDESIYIEVSGDVKNLYVPADMEVELRMVATDGGTMTYVIEKYEDGIPVERYNYYDLELTEDKTFTQSIGSDLFPEEPAMPVLTLSDGELWADEWLSAEDKTAFAVVTTQTNGAGAVIGGGNYAIGDSVELTAIPNETNTKFVGWFVGEELFSTDSTWRFPAREDVIVRAEFETIDPGLTHLHCIGDSEYVIDGEYLWEVPEGTTVDELLAQFENPRENLSVYDLDGAEVGSGEVRTGYTIRLTADEGVADSLTILSVGQDHAVLLGDMTLGETTLSIPVTNLTREGDFVVLLASYTEEGQYQGLIWEPVKDLARGETVELTFALPEGAEILKAFAVTSLAEAEPLSNTVSFGS